MSVLIRWTTTYTYFPLTTFQRNKTYSSKQMTITSSRKPDKLGGRLSSEVEHWGSNPKVRGSIPRVSRIYRVQRVIDIIDC